MALPNHPDVAYEFVKTLNDCGYQWVLVQEHSVEQVANGWHPQRPHLPHRLVCTNSKGETASIIAIIKTQGSDTKLVAQMQPWYEAQSLQRWELAGKQVPPLVTQIADGENGGVMMNEFPDKFFEVVRNASGGDVPLMNGSEYLEHLFALGIKESDFTEIRPVQQGKIWERMQPGDGPEKLEQVIEALKKEDHQFHMDGGSWTNDLSWVKGYENVLGPMEEASSLFNEKVLKPGTPTDDPRYRNALYHLMASQTSCYRYWGQGQWTDYGREICRRVVDICNYDFGYDGRSDAEIVERYLAASRFGALVINRRLECFDRLGGRAVYVTAPGAWGATLARLCDHFFSVGPKDWRIAGVTGTNGKTTTVKYLESILLAAGRRVLSIGTLGLALNGKPERDTGFTSPPYIELRRILAAYRDRADTLLMEVSSHALHQERVFGLRFDAAAWTNFSQDHLDYHGDEASYFDAKALILRQLADGVPLLTTSADVAERLQATGAADAPVRLLPTPRLDAGAARAAVLGPGLQSRQLRAGPSDGHGAARCGTRTSPGARSSRSTGALNAMCTASAPSSSTLPIPPMRWTTSWAPSATRCQMHGC
jgi:hypothetical protein